jgi:hypothetical protein
VNVGAGVGVVASDVAASVVVTSFGVETATGVPLVQDASARASRTEIDTAVVLRCLVIMIGSSVVGLSCVGNAGVVATRGAYM